MVERAKSSLVPWPNIKTALLLIARNESCVGRNLTGLSIMFPAFALASSLLVFGSEYDTPIIFQRYFCRLDVPLLFLASVSSAAMF